MPTGIYQDDTNLQFYNVHLDIFQPSKIVRFDACITKWTQTNYIYNIAVSLFSWLKVVSCLSCSTDKMHSM